MKLRLLALPLTALFLASCSQDFVTPTPDTALAANGASTDIYTLDAETAPTNRILYGVKVGQGIKYEGEDLPNKDKVLLLGYRYRGTKKLEGNQAKVVSDGMTKALTVVKAGTTTPNPDGGILRIKPPKSYSDYVLTSLTVRGIDKEGAFVRVTADGKDTTYELPLAHGSAQTLELEATTVEVIHVSVNDAFSLDNVTFELPNKEDDFVGKEIVGTWEGSAYQAGFGSYSIKLDITKGPNADQVIAEVTYPSLACGGDWTFKSAEGSKYTFAEQITYGMNNCVVSSDVSVTYNQDGSLTYDWQYYTSNATGTLYRAK